MKTKVKNNIKKNNGTNHFNVNIDWENGRKGLMCSPELKRENGICIEVATPPAFHKGIAGIWSPEHFFVAAVTSCLMTTFLAIAENSLLNFTSFSCKAIGKMENIERKLMMSEIHLKPTVVISKEMHRKKAMRILKETENTCLITRSIKSKVIIENTIQITPILIETT